ncbi:uncharacterized protein ColSpa_00173 [Colletotrichum spaethianum]|uniref:Transmembrane protein n=1 Tax=Colletotrichum spaethianum TaxID=700344 RepID=A0AA37L183_9PEZI|nr:uncharacterized protein ColSpa_00173 [Colletotrichum spaethianum]GKT39992.1 hypothetical protein ColSpa_00173 [Colletotrichum spaethianum]
MRISIIARGKDTCDAGLSYFECKEGYRGCCHFNPCPGTNCPRELSVTQPGKIVASVAAPVLVSAIDPLLSKRRTITMTSTITTYKSKSMQATTTTVFLPDATGPGGAWYTDPKGRLVSTVSSLDPSLYPTVDSSPSVPFTLVEPQVLITSTSTAAPEPGSGNSGLSTAAQAGIAASVLIVLVAIIAAWFLCTKQRRKLRGSRESIRSISRDGNSRKGSTNGSKEDQSNPPIITHPFQPNGPSSFGGHYEEPQTRFSRVSNIGSEKMMNHPISPDTRNLAIWQPPSAVIARVNIVSPGFTPRTVNATPDFICRTANTTPDFTSRTANATPDFISRLGTATPEVHGPPQQAAIAELASPGRPKVVEICSTRNSVQMYKAYHPMGNSLYPVAETSPSYLTGKLNPIEDEGFQDRYVNCWTKWDPIA